MRIGIDSRLNYYRPGGTVEYTRQVIRELASLDTASDYRIIQHVRDRERLRPGKNFRRLNTLTPCHHRLERWSLSAELAPYRLDLLHTPDIIPPQGGARRHVITIHDLHFLHYPQFMTADSRRHYRDRVGWAVQHADHILVSSQSTLHDLSTLLNVPQDKVTIHMLGVDAAFKPLPPEEVERHTKRLGLPPHYLLFVGTFEPRKNIPGLARAYRQVIDVRTDCPPLVLVGRRWLVVRRYFPGSRSAASGRSADLDRERALGRSARDLQRRISAGAAVPLRGFRSDRRRSDGLRHADDRVQLQLDP